MELEAAFQARLLSGKGAALALPLLQQLPQLVREPGQGLVVPPRLRLMLSISMLPTATSRS